MIIKKLSKLCLSRHMLAWSLLGISTIAVASSAVPENMQTGWNSITQLALKSDMTYLTSDKLEGRLALGQGDTLTIDWIEKQFKEIGLQPAAGDSYLQAVSLVQFVPDRKNSYVSLQRSGAFIKWHKPDVSTDYHNNIHLDSDVYFVGYGITAPDLNYDDYQHIDVKGKIVLAFEHEPQERNNKSIFNGTANTIYATNRVKALNAQQHGAIAILMMPEPNRMHLSNLERYNRIGGSSMRKKPLPLMALAQDDLHIPIAVLSDKVAAEIAGKSISLKELQQSIDTDLTPQSRLIPGTTVTIHDENKSTSTGVTYNVVGLLEGSDDKLKNETIIISGHHDHDGMSGKQIWHGADDNASGTVGVVTLARAMKENAVATNGLSPKRSILFTVFAAEERGLLGSYYMASHPLRPLKSTKAMLNFDMIGRNEVQTPQTQGMIAVPANTTNRLNLIGAHYSPDYKAIIVRQNQHVGLTLDNRFDSESALNAFFRSDQFPFILNQVPAFWWFTGFHPDYHHVTDTADKINYEKMQKILRLAYLTAYVLVETEVTPAFVKNP